MLFCTSRHAIGCLARRLAFGHFFFRLVRTGLSYPFSSVTTPLAVWIPLISRHPSVLLFHSMVCGFHAGMVRNTNPRQRTFSLINALWTWMCIANALRVRSASEYQSVSFCCRSLSTPSLNPQSDFFSQNRVSTSLFFSWPVNTAYIAPLLTIQPVVILKGFK